MGLILERFTTKGTILESDRGKLEKGVLCRVKYPICNIGEMNRNKRIYERNVWEKVFESNEVKEKLEKRIMYMQEEHPNEGSQTVTSRIAGIVTEIFIDESDRKVYSIVEVLDTPYGRIVETLLNAKCGIGVSTRAEGELEAIEEDGNTFYRVIPESYDFKTIDFTADPSTYGAFPEQVERNVVGIIHNGLTEVNKEHRLDTAYAISILERLKCDEARVLAEKVKNNDLDEYKPVVFRFEDLYADMLDLTNENSDLQECKTVKDVTAIMKRQYKNLVKEKAIAIAERDKMIELYDESAEKIIKLKEKYTNDILEFTDSNNKLKESVNDKKSEDCEKAINEFNLYKQKVKNDLLKLKNMYENKIKETATRIAETTAVEVQEVYEAKLKELEESYNTKINAREAEFKKQLFVETVVMPKIVESGLELPNELINTLKECSNSNEIDNLLNKIRLNIKESMIKPDKVDVAIVENKYSDSPQMAKQMSDLKKMLKVL